MRPTIQDVAAAAGVSAMTVSNVVNGRRGKVSPETQQRVRDAIERLGYVPDASARALSSRVSTLVALVYPELPYGRAEAANPHDAILLLEVERRLRQAGRHLIVEASADVARTTANLQSWNMSGAIVLGTFGEEVERFQLCERLPTVFVDNHSEVSTVATVGIDDRRGGELAGAHLALAGHERIGFVGPSHDHPGVVRQRYLGFTQALADHGRQLDPGHVVTCHTTFEDGIDAASQLLRAAQPPTAVFATADVLAGGLLRGFVSQGVAVPDHVSVVGFDDLPLARQLTPELTTVRQDIAGKAHAAVDLLLELTGAWPERPSRRVELDLRLVERGSVAGPPVSVPPTR